MSAVRKIQSLFVCTHKALGLAIVCEAFVDVPIRLDEISGGFPYGFSY